MGFLAPVAQFLGAIFVGAGAGAQAGYLLAVNVARLGLLALSAKVFTPKPDLSRTAQSKRVTFRDPIAPQTFIYGEDMVSGPMLYSNVAGDQNRDLYIIVALAGHEIDSVTKYRIDSTDVPLTDLLGGGETGNVNGGKFAGVARVTIRKGSSTQTTIPDLTAAFPGNFNVAHTGRGWAYMLWEFNLVNGQEDVFKTQPTNLRAVVRGKKVYDPRLDSTNGGAGAHRLADPTTWEWSNNPALCLADFIRDDKFGMREDDARVDWPLVIAAANVCDQTVTVPAPTNSQSRYTCNATFSSTETRGAVRDELLASMMGRMVFSQGKWKMWAGAAITPDVTLDEANLAGGITVQASSPSSERYNRVRGKYIDPDRDYVASTYVEQRSSTYEAEDGGEIRELVADFTSTQNEFEAQRKAIATLKQSRQQRVVVFEGNYSCFRIQPGTTVLLTVAELGFSGEKFFVTEWRFNESGVQLTMVEEIDSAWADPLVGDYSTRSATGVLTFGETGVPAPTGLAVTPSVQGNLVSWTNPLANTFSHVEVWASTTNDRNAATIVGTSQTESLLHVIFNVENRTQYYWVRSVDARGRVSAFTPDLTTTTVFVAPLANRDNLNVDPEFNFSDLPINGVQTNPFWEASVTSTGDLVLQVGSGSGGGNAVDFIDGNTGTWVLRNKKYSLWGKSKGTFLAAIRYKTIGTADALDHELYRTAIETTDNPENPTQTASFFQENITLPRNATANWQTVEFIISFEILQPSSIPDEFIRFTLNRTATTGTADTLRVDSFSVIPLGTEFGKVTAGTEVKPGLVPQASAANATQFLRGDGTWADASGGGGIADGTIVGSMLRWNGSAWVEETGIRHQATRLDLIQSTQAILRLNATSGGVDQKITDVRMTSTGGFAVQAVTDGGSNGPILMSGIRSGTTWTELQINCAAQIDTVLEIRAPGDATATTITAADALGTSNIDIGTADNLSLTGSALELFDLQGGAAIQFTETNIVPGGAPAIGRGKLWVRNNTPNKLIFTDDAGTDHDILAGPGETIPSGSATGSVLRWSGSAWVEETNMRVATDGSIEIGVGGSSANLTIWDGGASAMVLNKLGGAGDSEIDIGTSNNLAIFGSAIQRLDLQGGAALRLTETNAAPASVAARGQFWVRNDIPCVPMFTNDAGTDFNLIDQGGLSGTVANDQIVVGTGASSVDSSANLTFNGASLAINGSVTMTGDLVVSGNDISSSGALNIRQSGVAEYLTITNTLSAQSLFAFSGNSIIIGSGANNHFAGDGTISYIYYNGTEHLSTQSILADGNTSGARLRAHDNTFRDVGFNELVIEVNNTSVTLIAEHCGAVIYFNDSVAGKTVSTAASTSLDFPVGGMVTIINHSDTTRSIVQTSGTSLLWQDGTSGQKSGNRTLARGVANIWRHSSGAYFIWGVGLS